MTRALAALPRLGVLHAAGASATARDIMVAARGLCRPVFLIRRPASPTDRALAATLHRIAETHEIGADPAAITSLGLDGLTTFVDAEVESGGRPFPRDKLRQRTLLRQAGCSAIPALAVDSADDLAAAAHRTGLPGVVKQRRGMSSVGLAFLADGAALATHLRERQSWADLLYEPLIPTGRHPTGEGWLADYVSVDTASAGGRRHHLAVLAKLPLSVVPATGPQMRHAVRETGDVYPARLPASVLAEVQAATERALDALDVDDRLTHTELKLSPTGVEVIEVNGRLGGEVATVVRTAGGPDLVRCALSLALAPAGWIPPRSAADLQVSALQVPFAAREGLVRSDVRPEHLTGLPGIAGIDGLARHGHPRSAFDFRLATLHLRMPQADLLRDALAAAAGRLAHLFAADGADGDPWLTRLRGSLSAGTLATEAS